MFDDTDERTINYISSVYGPFSDRVGLPLNIIPSPGVLMNYIGAEFLRPDVVPGVNHMRGVKYPKTSSLCCYII